MLVMLACLLSGCLGSQFELESLDALLLPRRRSADPGLSQTFFPNLINVEIGSDRADESDYPWIARVVHSTKNVYPHMCTAACIHAKMFITSAYCIYHLKIKFTTVIYQKTKLSVLAFVRSNITTKQLYDDIGLIVVDDEGYGGKWPTIELISRNRSGEGFQWFADWQMEYRSAEYKAVGYATDKSMKENAAIVQYYLSSLNVVVNINLCYTILSVNDVRGFYVPCYHSCSLQEFKMKDHKCGNFLGVEGAAVIDVKLKKLIGVATWSASSRRTILPVGFAVPNSDVFFKNYDCAMSIASKESDDNTLLLARRSLQELCRN